MYNTHKKQAYTEDILYQFFHWCDDCSKAYDFTCSGADASLCETKKNKLLAKIQTSAETEGYCILE